MINVSMGTPLILMSKASQGVLTLFTNCHLYTLVNWDRAYLTSMLFIRISWMLCNFHWTTITECAGWQLKHSVTVAQVQKSHKSQQTDCNVSYKEISLWSLLTWANTTRHKLQVKPEQVRLQQQNPRVHGTEQEYVSLFINWAFHLLEDIHVISSFKSYTVLL